MFDYIFGLPMHALVIHAVVVFVPLSALAAVGYAVRPRWRRVLRWPTAVGAVISGGSAFVAAESGEQLLRRVSAVRPGTTDFALLAQHQTWGDRAKVVGFLFMVLTLALVWFVRPPEEQSTRSRPIDTVLSVLAVVAAAAATTTVVLAGHAGSAAVWHGLG
ncbi:DUF2231 domain-containing protein [Intrasporangium sp. YIM S08009]|uniref:DUF2231 domain-containing protein n=1 Tax=Intrasporangium zincisolvens TaxID=3080018 RepID=UPI002B05B785|nr:DUF2231 domain-containing protein [Intrasporangium sp. YIM S08009]